MRRERQKRVLWMVGVVTVLIGVSGCETLGPQGPEEVDAKAAEVLTGMSETIGGREAMTFRATRVTDRELADFLNVPTSSRAEVMVSAPNRFRAKISDPATVQSAFFDGSTLTLYHHGEKLYASERVARRSTSGALDVIERRYGFMPPLADFVVLNPYENLTRYMTTVTYEGEEWMGGVRCDHVSATGEEVDWDIWVGVKDRLPRRYTVTAKEMESRPQWRTDFKGFDFGAGFPEEHFTFVPPEGAHAIPMIRKGDDTEDVMRKARELLEE
ncbi:MAG: DUF2092 domain-containing protein [Verrucomicrobiota bacterium]